MHIQSWYIGLTPACCWLLVEEVYNIVCAMQVSMASGLDWNSEEEGTAGADALKVEDLIELSEGDSGQSNQASLFRNALTGGSMQHMHTGSVWLQSSA